MSFVSRLSPSSRLSRFGRDEAGSALVLSLFLIVGMVLAVGVGIDTMRYEVERAKTQHAIDTAVLAAASLREERDPRGVAEDIMRRHGLDPADVTLQITDLAGEKTVAANTTVDVPSMFLKFAGNAALTGPAGGAAVEKATDVEIVLVLDNSGSMGWNGNYRLNLLKDAAKQFVDDVIGGGSGMGNIAISVVPFATQVAAGPTLTEFFNVSDEHSYSHCVNFAQSDFDDAGIDPSQELERTGHFDIFTWSATLQTQNVVCPFDTAREITLWETDPDTLKARIDAMWAGGNTSIDLGTKWGTALLDPSIRPLVTDLAAQGAVSSTLAGMPYDYGRPNTKKYLVVMSDGQNTDQYYLNPSFRQGGSQLWRGPAGTTCIPGTAMACEGGLYHRVGNSNQFYDVANATMLTLDDGLAGGTQMDWPETNAEMSVARYALDVQAAAEGGQWQTYYNRYFNRVPAGQKNNRASAICGAARDAGITVFTVGMDTYGQGDATLLDCASAPALFFDVAAQDIGDAFSSIARQITQLRLTN